MRTRERPERQPRAGSEAERADVVRAAAQPLTGAADDYDTLLDQIGDARLVLLGEASHGTHEFYRVRAELTKRLIEEKGFTAVAVEADWPDAYRVNRFGLGIAYTTPEGTPLRDETAEEALRGFERFPTWMWRNADVLDFVGWLRGRNESLRPGEGAAGFYGVDLYSLYASMEAVIAYLDRIDPEAAARARARYGCFEEFEKDSEAYGAAAHRRRAEPCEDEVVAQLVDLQRHATAYAGGRPGGAAAAGQETDADEYFFAEQNARVARSAERYYRTMFRGGRASWNLRDRHMVETLAALIEHLDQRAGREGATKVAVWAHNSHLGDARATAAAARGQLNVGQLVRERWPGEAFLVGFSTYAGTVTAARDWGMPAERRRVRPGLPGSYEALLHQAAAAVSPRGETTGRFDFFLPLRVGDLEAEAIAVLRPERLQRFIGVIYRPEAERWSHYDEAVLPRQFDALLYFDQTRAVEPLERTPRWVAGESGDAEAPREAPETFPSTV